jgi:hypothetical protein
MMKDPKLSEPNKRKYFVAFIGVTALNILLAGFLLNSFGQSSGRDTRNQPPLKVEVAIQDNCPLRLTVINVDNSPSWYQAVNYAVQNASGKPILGYVILASGKHTGQIVTGFFPIKSFRAGDSHAEEMSIEHVNIRPDEVLSLSIDYIEFDDESSWGADTQGQSEHMAGGRAGVIAAAKQFIDLIKKRQFAALTPFLEKKLVDIVVPFPDKVQSEKWRQGFDGGYKGIVSVLQTNLERGYQELLKKLDEIRRGQIDRTQD